MPSIIPAGTRSWHRRHAVGMIVMACLPLLGGCSSPAGKADARALHHGFSRQELTGDPYVHVAYQNRLTGNGQELHVYIEGDGLPWSKKNRISADPTPRNPIMLELMSLDNHPSVYLGRPCYFGTAGKKPCEPFDWTHGRYSPRVVKSMQHALQERFSSGEYASLVLFGYSGGGTLAVLLAPLFPQTRAVVTLAGNLDTDKWAAYQGYSPLSGSLNPARQQPLPGSIAQYHFAGGSDKTVPPTLIQQALAGQHSMQFILLDDFDHSCCWQQIWENVLECLEGLCVYPGE